MSGEAAVSAREVNYRFDSARVAAPALAAVSLEIAAGEFVVLTGPSGSGKTTLLTLIGALRKPQQGSVRTLGRELGGLDEPALARVRRDIGFIFQEHNLFDALTARETLALAMRLHAERYGDADYQLKPARLLSKFGLGDHVDALPGELSTGERQRVAIARALINEPRLILADEPTASLDASSAAVVLDLFAHAVREIGASVVMVSHDSRHHALSDRVITLVDGCIVGELRPGGQ